MKKNDGMKADRDKKSNGERVDHEKGRWGES